VCAAAALLFILSVCLPAVWWRAWSVISHGRQGAVFSAACLLWFYFISGAYLYLRFAE
jgi:hypothetical protein